MDQNSICSICHKNEDLEFQRSDHHNIFMEYNIETDLDRMNDLALWSRIICLFLGFFEAPQMQNTTSFPNTISLIWSCSRCRKVSWVQSSIKTVEGFCKSFTCPQCASSWKILLNYIKIILSNSTQKKMKTATFTIKDSQRPSIIQIHQPVKW